MHRRPIGFTVTALSTLAFASGIALSAKASTVKAHRRHSLGAVKLPRSRLKRVNGIVCGKVRGRWVSGAIVSRGYFLSDARRAHNDAARGAHATGHAKKVDQSHATFYRRRAKRRRVICRGVTQTDLSVPNQDTYISSQFFGQHLMFNWGLKPQIPVHAMRLWDSNTGWCDIDKGTSSNQYDFGQLDALLQQASDLGADVEFTFGNTPRWAAAGSYPQPASVNQCSGGLSNVGPADESDWIKFVTALVMHCKGRIHAYELWNEVDYSAFWSGGVATMVRMSIDASTIIHKLDPSAVVLSPSITARPEGYAFLHQYLSSLPLGTVDAIAVHSYTGGVWPEETLPPEMKAVRAALPSDYANTPIWSTEGGWGLNSQFSSSASDQRAFVARYDLQMLAQGVTRSYWYAYQNTQWDTLWDGTALTPAGIATATLNRWLVGAGFEGCGTSDGNLWSCNLTTSSGKARIVWVRTTPVGSYSTLGYRSVSSLDGSSSPTNGLPIAVSTEPVLLSS